MGTFTNSVNKIERNMLASCPSKSPQFLVRWFIICLDMPKQRCFELPKMGCMILSGVN